MKFSGRVLAAACLGVCLLLSGLLSAQGPQADANLTLFSVVAPAVAADESGAVYNSPLAQQLRKDLAGKDLPSLKDINRFLALNKAGYTQLVSFALVVDGPPDFGFRYREVDLPSDAQSLIGLNALLAEFYREAKLEVLWDKYKPAYEAQAAIYNE